MLRHVAIDESIEYLTLASPKDRIDYPSIFHAQNFKISWNRLRAKDEERATRATQPQFVLASYKFKRKEKKRKKRRLEKILRVSLYK